MPNQDSKEASLIVIILSMLMVFCFFRACDDIHDLKRELVDLKLAITKNQDCKRVMQEFMLWREMHQEVDDQPGDETEESSHGSVK